MCMYSLHMSILQVRADKVTTSKSVPNTFDAKLKLMSSRAMVKKSGESHGFLRAASSVISTAQYPLTNKSFQKSKCSVTLRALCTHKLFSFIFTKNC